jgi:hypothetical protein
VDLDWIGLDVLEEGAWVTDGLLVLNLMGEGMTVIDTWLGINLIVVLYHGFVELDERNYIS